MEVKQINQLMQAMGKTGTKKLVLKHKGFELELEREGRVVDGLDDVLEENPMRQEIETHYKSATVCETKKPKANEKIEDDGLYVTSPMVGTIYLAPSPSDPAFIKPGDTVDANTVVCIIEAMKVMNEVKAGISGVISDVLVENGQPVEFGSKLFRVTPK